MAASEELGILGVHSFHYFVHDAERSRAFYEDRFGWHPAYRTGDDVVTRTGQSSTVYEAGDVRVAVSTAAAGSAALYPRAARWLSRHPDGIGSISYQVQDIEKAWSFLTNRDATPIHAISESRVGTGTQQGRFRHFSITTALGDVTFRFIQIDDWDGFAPGYERLPAPTGVVNPMGFTKVDHITCNAQTMAGYKLWLQHVMGMEQCWEIEFHTEDIKQGGDMGTGLRSVVMWDPRSGLKYPINEPLQPFFKEGQINKFIEDNHGAGVQHVALEVNDIMAAVKSLRDRGVGFLHTPGNYYDTAPERLRDGGVEPERIFHKMADLRDLGILIDGSPVDNYLVQIFLNDAMTLYDENEAGPFFYELIERRGDQGFGGGNFRALFEAIEREQTEG
ncbi:MAG: VOC family protein [Myxococcales bacterium]|nr:VOC family protein [Myxococcales bacterium]